MSIKSTQIGIANTELLLATAETALLTVTFCNTSDLACVISMHMVKNGYAVSDTNTIIKDLSIAAKDTYVWSGMDKFILDSGDFISAIAASASSIAATVSYKII
jgi:hypothetical protein